MSNQGLVVAPGVGDFGDVAKKLRERIQSAFVDLIPQERWDEMLKAEVEKFMADRVEKNTYGHETKRQPSEFSRLCQSALGELVDAEVKRRFKEISHEQLVAAVSTWLENNAQAMLMEFVQQMFKSGVQEGSAALTSWVSFKLRDWANGR